MTLVSLALQACHLGGPPQVPERFIFFIVYFLIFNFFFFCLFRAAGVAYGSSQGRVKLEL